MERSRAASYFPFLFPGLDLIFGFATNSSPDFLDGAFSLASDHGPNGARLERASQNDAETRRPSLRASAQGQNRRMRLFGQVDARGSGRATRRVSPTSSRR